MMHVDKWRSPRLYTSKFRSRPSDSNQNLCLRGPKRETSHVTLRIKLSVRQDAAMTNRLLKPMWPRNFNNILTSSSKLFHHRPLLWKTKRIAVQSSLKSTQHNNNSTLWARRVKIRKPKISSILNNSTKTLRSYWIDNSRTVRPNYRFLTQCWLSIRCYLRNSSVSDWPRLPQFIRRRQSGYETSRDAKPFPIRPLNLTWRGTG